MYILTHFLRQEREKTALQDVAYSLVQLQEMLGSIPHVHIVGSVSKDVATFTKCLMRADSSISNKQKSHISDLLLMDRDTDMVSVLASQLTYEGVLDEAFAIECGEYILCVLQANEQTTNRIAYDMGRE